MPEGRGRPSKLSKAIADPERRTTTANTERTNRVDDNVNAILYNYAPPVPTRMQTQNSGRQIYRRYCVDSKTCTPAKATLSKSPNASVVILKPSFGSNGAAPMPPQRSQGHHWVYVEQRRLPRKCPDCQTRMYVGDI